MDLRYRLNLVFIIMGTSVFAGCAAEKAEDTSVSVHRQSFLLDARPVSTTTLAKAQDEIKDNSDISIEGWADLKYFESDNGTAKFMVREILDDTDHGGEGHDPSSCPFCKRRMQAAPKAAVVFTDESSKIIPIAITELFDVEHGDKVIVQGRGKFDEQLALLQVKATHIHIPNAE